MQNKTEQSPFLLTEQKKSLQFLFSKLIGFVFGSSPFNTCT